MADLLGFSRSAESAMESMDLNTSIQDVVDLVSQIFRQERVVVETDFDPTVPPIVGDAARLKQVWMNLLSNAFDAIGSDGHILVGTKLCSHRRRVVVTVAATGAGIAGGDLPPVFDPFFTTNPVGAGTAWACPCLRIVAPRRKNFGDQPAPVEYLASEGDKNETKPPAPHGVLR